MHGFQGQTPGRMNQGGFGGNTAGTHAGLTGIQQQVLKSIFCCVITQHFKVNLAITCTCLKRRKNRTSKVLLDWCKIFLANRQA